MSTSISLPTNDKSHHIGTPPTHFKNPWPSYRNHGLVDFLQTRFRSDRNFVPIPTDKTELVTVRKPTFGHNGDLSATAKLKATWLGHASWLIEFPTAAGRSRGVTILLDPVFAERTSPVSFLGPKRYTDHPCAVGDLPAIDAVLISHNHYDHLDIDVVKFLHARSSETVFLAPLRNREWFLSAAGVKPENVVECDWWDAVRLGVEDAGSVSIVCTPAQHASARTPFDRDAALWSSWAIGATEDIPGSGTDATNEHEQKTTGPATQSTAKVTVKPYSTSSSSKPDTNLSSTTPSPNSIPFSHPRIYFAGDTGYRDIQKPFPSSTEQDSAPCCPVFAQIGHALGPFDLALVPVGLYSPRDVMSAVHCAPEDSVCLAIDIQARRTLGMHFGTYRGGLSQYFEDVREPERRFRDAVREKGLRWMGRGTEGKEGGVVEDGQGEGEDERVQVMGTCDIGETVFV